jgi:long-chain acyl-CoA synthetase
MRGPLDVVMRWWKEGNGNGNGNGNGRGNGHGAAPTAVGESPAPRQETPPEPPWLAQLDREGIPRSLRYPTSTLARIVDQAADRFGDLPAVIYHPNRWSYRELLATINRMAGGLARLGVRKGDRVVLTLPNCPEYVVSFFAIQKLGAVVVNAGPLMGADDLRAVMTLTDARVLIGLDLQASHLIAAAKDSAVEHFIWVTLQSYQTLLKRMGYQIKLWQGREPATGSAEHTSVATLLGNAPAKPPTIEPHPDATAVLQPTSGTTGSLKLARLSHHNLLANAMQVSVWMGAREGQERVLTVLPMFHVYGLMTGLINPLLCAATITLMTRFDAAQTLDALEREQPTVFPLVPLICDALNNEIERRERPTALRGLRACISGAAPLPKEMAERFQRLTGARVIEGYGLSEASPVTHANPMSRPRYGSIGLPMPDTLCRVVDLDQVVRDVPTGQPGEMLVSGPQVMGGYFHNPEETQRILWVDEHGRTWLRTGDVVRMDEDGFFQVLDRKKDMIIRSGLKVYPAKVEKVLLAHARVADAAVIGRADPVRTEVVVAFIVVKDVDPDREALAEELRALCRQHLAPYEVPTAFEFIAHIPRSALGKVLKKELRQIPESSPKEPEIPQKERKEA